MKFSEFINESIIDLPRKDYSRTVFDKFKTNSPVLKLHIKTMIEKQLKKFEKIAPVKNYKLIGSILTKRYRKDADLDINVLFDADEATHEKLKKASFEANGKTVPDGQHPINYFTLIDKKQFDRTNELSDGVYDIKTDKLEKSAKDTIFNADNYIEEFKTKVYKLDLLKGELQRDIIDFTELDELDDDDIANLDIALSKKLKEIESDIELVMSNIVKIGDATTKERNLMFAKDITPKEIKKYGSHHKLPQNVIYKLLEKYYYIRLYKDLKKALGDDGTLSKGEVKKLKHLAKPLTMVSENLYAQNPETGEIKTVRSIQKRYN